MCRQTALRRLCPERVGEGLEPKDNRESCLVFYRVHLRYQMIVGVGPLSPQSKISTVLWEPGEGVPLLPCLVSDKFLSLHSLMWLWYAMCSYSLNKCRRQHQFLSPRANQVLPHAAWFMMDRRGSDWGPPGSDHPPRLKWSQKLLVEHRASQGFTECRVTWSRTNRISAKGNTEEAAVSVWRLTGTSPDEYP